MNLEASVDIDVAAHLGFVKNIDISQKVCEFHCGNYLILLTEMSFRREYSSSKSV